MLVKCFGISILCALLMLATSCQTPSQNTPGEEPVSSGVESPSNQSVGRSGAETSRACQELLKVPGPNTQAPDGYEHEIAYAHETGQTGYDKATTLARQKLKERLCQQAACDEVAREIRSSTTQSFTAQLDGATCALAIANRRIVRELLITPSERFQRGVQLQVQELERAFPAGTHVALESVVDRGVPGGELAEWATGVFQEKLSKSGHFTLVDAPTKASNKNATAVVIITGRVYEIDSQSTKKLELSWSAREGGRVVALSRVDFPQEIAPRIDPTSRYKALPATWQPPKPIATARFEPTRPGGSVCHGEPIELGFSTERKAHVRIFGISGDGELGVLLYASDDAVHKPVFETVLSGSVQQVTRVATQQVIVIAAEKRAGLGPFANLKERCRLPDSVTQHMHLRELQLAAPATISHTGYRILSPQSCAVPTEPLSAEDAQKILDYYNDPSRFPRCNIGLM